jgi:two-component system, NarL family, invasion response regulator UvrY
MKTAKKFLIIEDHGIVAAAMERIISDLYPEAQVDTAPNFPKGLKSLEIIGTADLVILDMDIPGGESFDMIRILRAKQPGIRILIFTGHDENRYAVRFLSAGANGFLSKHLGPDECVRALKLVMDDKKYMSEEVHQMVAKSFFEKINPLDEYKYPPLSPREKEVLDLLLDGKATKEIGDALNLKLTTVSTHKTRIFEKLQVTNIIELFKKLRPEEF